jgi:hypothetical protein
MIAAVSAHGWLLRSKNSRLARVEDKRTYSGSEKQHLLT